ncbi:hypothetical protein C0995_015084 [Termitomyces sp. Mi166|nr:hypothetical protein C0995_015084 [Termitomyces sp. Mi166\
MARIKNPSAKLTDPSNVARPQLTQHCTSIAHVQPPTTPSATTTLPNEADSGSELRHANQSVTARIDQDIKVMEIKDPESEKTVLHPTCKMIHFKKHWDSNLQNEVLTLIENVSQLSIFTVQGVLSISTISTFLQFFFMSEPPPKKRRISSTLLWSYDTDSEDSDSDIDNSNDPSQPWMDEFRWYLNTNDILPDGMTIVEWWGIHDHRYSTWASLAHDYLAVMASSVSSEHAFSSAGITISKRCNRLKGDVAEASQCLKCMFRNDLIFWEVQMCADEEILMDDCGGEDLIVRGWLTMVFQPRGGLKQGQDRQQVNNK